MPFDTNVTSNFQQLEYQKFVNIVNETQFPPVSVLRTSFNNLTSIDVYPKTAILTYQVNTVPLSVQDIQIGAVEIKNSSSDDRVIVDTSGNLYTAAAPRNTTAWGGVSGLTSTDGTSYTAFGSVPANTVTIYNTNSAALLVRSSAGVPFVLPANTGIDIFVVANTNEISFRRQDASTVRLDVYGVYHKY